MTEIGLLKAAGAVAFTDGDKSVTNAQVMRRALTYAGDFDALIVHHTEDPDLIGDGVMNEGEFAARLGLLGIPKAAETVMLERDIRLVALSGGRYHAGLDHLRGIARGAAPRQGCRPRCHRLSLDQSHHAQRKRHRALSHLPETVAAVARRGRPQAAGRGARQRPDRHGDVGSQSAGRRDQAAAVRRSRARRDRPGDHAGRRLAAGACRRDRPDDLAARDVDAAGGTARPAGRHAEERRAGRHHRRRPRHAVGARSGRAQIEVQEHAVR